MPQALWIDMDNGASKKAKKMPVLYSSRLKAQGGADDNSRSKSVSKIVEQ